MAELQYAIDRARRARVAMVSMDVDAAIDLAKQTHHTGTCCNAFSHSDSHNFTGCVE